MISRYFYAEKAKEKNCRGLNNKEFYYFYLMHPQYRAMSISHSPFVITSTSFCRWISFVCGFAERIFSCAWLFVLFIFIFMPRRRAKWWWWYEFFFGTLYCACCLLFHSLLNDFILTSYTFFLTFCCCSFFLGIYLRFVVILVDDGIYCMDE